MHLHGQLVSACFRQARAWGQTLRRKGCSCWAVWLLGMHELLTCMWPAGRRVLVAAGTGMEGPLQEALGTV